MLTSRDKSRLEAAEMRLLHSILRKRRDLMKKLNVRRQHHLDPFQKYMNDKKKQVSNDGASVTARMCYRSRMTWNQSLQHGARCERECSRERALVDRERKMAGNYEP